MNRALLVLFVAAMAAPARAQPAGAQAEVLFRQGRELMAAGKIPEACAAFDESQKLEPAVTTLLNLAGCREKNGQLASAWGLFLEAERQTRDAADDAMQKLHEVAQARAQKLEPRVSKLTISVPEKSKVAGLEIVRGEERIEAVMWNRALPVDGGTYTITARARGAKPWSTAVSVAPESDAKTVEIPALALEMGTHSHAEPAAPQSAPQSQPAAPETPRGPEAPSSLTRLMPWAVGGGAVVLLGSALAFNFWGDSQYSQAKSDPDPARRAWFYDAANQKRYAAQGLAVGGVAAAGVAVWLYLRGRHDPSDGAVARHVVVSPAGITLLGAF